MSTSIRVKNPGVNETNVSDCANRAFQKTKVKRFKSAGCRARVLQARAAVIVVFGVVMQIAGLSWANPTIYWPGGVKNLPAGLGYTCEIVSDKNQPYEVNLWSSAGDI